MPAVGEPRHVAVLDSNVLISAFAFPGGTPYRILRAVVRGDTIKATISPHILREIERTLRDKLRVAERSVGDALDLLHEHCLVIDPPPSVSIPTLSAADNRVLDCAVAGEALHLVTGDRGIQRLGEYRGIAIVSPAEFVDILRLIEGETGY